MKIRRYIGKDTQEAILKVKMDLGSDAIILNTRKVKPNGFFNKIFAKPMIEVLAAVDEYAKQKEAEKKKADEKKEVVKETPKEVAKVQTNLVEKEEKISELENKVNRMENLLQKVYDQLQVTTPRNSVDRNAEKIEEKSQNQSKVVQLFYNNLVKNEVDPDIAKNIIDIVSKKVGNNASVNDTASILYNIIAEMLGKPQTINLRTDGKPTIVLFVGPTGVGKTTTLAKIAANYSLNLKKQVGLITADTYRIAAVDQLKTYAEILGMPVNVVYSAAEMKDAIEKYSDKDLVLIDTAGRSSRNRMQFDELKTFVSATEADEIFLVLSTTTSIKNCKDILHSYNFLKDYKLIFTKLDETPVTGIILNAKRLTNKCLSYVTTGQSVPDDIETANTEKITKNLLGSIT